MSEGEDIFVFLHRVEFELTSRAIPQHSWIKFLPSVLVGQYKEEYYNNVSTCTSFDDMKIVLLNLGGYSFSECLNSFPLKFRLGGHKTMLQWYNHWRYKFQVIMDCLPFLVNCTDQNIEFMSNVFATIAVLSGIPQESRDSILARPSNTNEAFIQVCNSWFHNASSSSKPSFPRQQQHQYQHHHSGHRFHSDNSHFDSHRQHRAPLLASPNTQSPPIRRDISTVTCFRCNSLGHYANNCPNNVSSIDHRSQSQNVSHTQPQPQPQSHSQVQPQAQSLSQPQQSQPVSNNNSDRPVRRIEHDSSSPTDDNDTDILNIHETDDSFITQGRVNDIPTDIIIDSGAKVSLISSKFISPDMVPVGSKTLFGISQIRFTVPVYELDVSLPTMKGKCRLAMDNRLPPFTFLLGIDFGKEKLLDLMSRVKATPVPVMAVTRAMAADNALADKLADTLHLSEGATPLALDDIVDISDTDTTISSQSVTVSFPNTPTVTPSLQPASLAPLTLPSVTFDGVSKEQFLELQKSDPSLAPLWNLAKNHQNSLFIAKGFLMCLTTTCNQVSSALVVPQSLRTKVLQTAHDGLGHGGLNTTRSLVNKHFSWPNMASDIKDYISKCTHCLKHNKSGGMKVPLCSPEIISERCEKIAVDIVGPLPKSKHNFRFIFTSMELASGFPFAVPLRTYTAEDTARALLSVIAVTGPPLAILSDQGSNFMSKVLSLLYQKLGISKVRTTPYHPQSNGRLERFHATLKAMLAKSIESKQHWPDSIDLVLYFARNTPHSRHGYTPHELLFLKPSAFVLSTLKSFWLGDPETNLNLPQFIQDINTQASCQNSIVKEALSSKLAKQRLSAEGTALSNLKIGDTVLKRVPGLNKCLESSWEGPYVIDKLLHPVNCAIKSSVKKGKSQVVHASQLKPAPDLSVYRVVTVIDDFLDDTPSIEKSMTLSEQQQLQLDDTLSQFPSVFSDTPGLTPLVKHSVRLTCSTPLWTPTYTLPLAYHADFRKEIDQLLALGIIEPSTSSWSSSPLPVSKKDGGLRIVVEFRKLNKVTTPEPFTMPSIDFIISQLGEAKFLSKLDLLKGFHQVPLADDSKHLTAFSCLQGKFQYRVMPFGLRNAPATFQLLMQEVLRGLEEFSLAYIDDIVIFSASFPDHIKHISSILDRLSQANLTVKKTKCSWFFYTFDFLGFCVGKGKISIPAARVAQLDTFVRPVTKSHLRSFLGLCTFYSRFISNFSHLASPLYSLLKRNSPDTLPWNEDYDSNFHKIISSITHHSSLIIPHCNEARCVFSDASLCGIGGVLCVTRSDAWMPCSFFSRQLLSREQKFSATELEALALLETIEHFKLYLAGRDFVAFTDHQALSGVLDGVPPSSKLARWKHKLAEYSVNIVYIKGAQNPVADSLSRQGWPQPQQPLPHLSQQQQQPLPSSPDTPLFQGGGDVVE